MLFGSIKGTELTKGKSVSSTSVIKNVSLVRASMISMLCYFLYGISFSFLPYSASLINGDALFTTLVSLCAMGAQLFISKPFGNLIDIHDTKSIVVGAAIISAIGFGLMYINSRAAMLVVTAI